MHTILAARTDFSIGQSILTSEHIVDFAVASNQSAVAITDTMSVTGLVDFTNRCVKKNIKPIIGVRLRLVENSAWRPGDGQKKKDMPAASYVTAYVLTEIGLKTIYRLLSLGNSADHFYYTSQLAFHDLYAELAAIGPGHLAINVSDIDGILFRPDGLKIAETIRDLIGVDYTYAAMMPIDTPYFSRLNQLAHRASVSLGLNRIAIRPAFYEKDGADAHEFMGGIANGNKHADGWHKSTENRDFHMIDQPEMDIEIAKAVTGLARRIPGLAAPAMSDALTKIVLANTQKLVDQVQYTWVKQPVSLPVMAADEFEALKDLCKLGWKKRFAAPVFGHQPTQKELLDDYLPRLKYELDVLGRLNFSGYFLLVQDVVRFAKDSEILVGPGRGSVGGSLVAYLTGITECDPIRFGLMFERFINPDRLDLPDADLDFMSARRNEIVTYLAAKYGEKRVAGVSNFGRLAASSVIRDVSRFWGLRDFDYACSKLVPKKHGQPVTLDVAANEVTAIGEFATKNDDIWPIMTRLEGTIRSMGQHAAGIVVGGIDLEERAVVERRDDRAVVCWDKRIVEDQGLVKMDILGLSTLDVIALTLGYIYERTGLHIDMSSMPLDDANVLANFAKGMTTGIFQFESAGMRRLLKELGADGGITFDDITAATALYRPGPMESGMMDSYYKRKQGNESIDYDHPFMEPVLRDTYGVIVYQEQVMKVSQVIAGYNGAEADKLRKIMGKKQPEEMAKERGKFVDGCVKTIGAEPQWAGHLFDKIEGFAGYGFNKSHSVEYTLISYQCMWLKTNYPVEFLAAALSLMDEDKRAGLIRDAKKLGIDVSMPDINVSTERYEIATAVRLVIPFMALKGISSTTTTAIVTARADGPFLNQADFLKRVDKRKCNVRHQDILNKVGAFSRIESGQLAATDPARIIDQLELLPGLIDATVPINHELHTDKLTKQAIVDLVLAYRNTHGPAGEADGQPIKPHFGRGAKFMIVQDCPSSEDDGIGSMGNSRNVECVKSALDEHGFKMADVYWTALVKRPKQDKQISDSEIAKYKPYLDKEVEILMPPVIVLLGGGVVRHFCPELKGKASDMAGKIVYSKVYDANFVIGFNPGELYYAPEKAKELSEVFATVVDLLP